MPKVPRWTAIQAERTPPGAGFELLRSKDSHRIYGKGIPRVTVPFHSGEALHPKIIKQVLEAIEEAGHTTTPSSSPPQMPQHQPIQPAAQFPTLARQ